MLSFILLKFKCIILFQSTMSYFQKIKRGIKQDNLATVWAWRSGDFFYKKLFSTIESVS